MKIVVTDRQVSFFNFRNDNTLIRDCDLLYTPQFVKELYPKIGYVFRVDKPAKSIESKHADRYLSLFTPALFFDGAASETSLFSKTTTPPIGNFLDHSSMVPLKLLPIEQIDECRIKLQIGHEKLISNYIGTELKGIAYNALSKFSYYFTLKIGDFIFIELEEFPVGVTKGEVEFFYNSTLIYNFEIK